MSFRTLKKSIAVIHAIAECEDCEWRAENYKNAQALGAKHAKKYKHRVKVEVGLVAIYQGVDI